MISLSEPIPVHIRQPDLVRGDVHVPQPLIPAALVAVRTAFGLCVGYDGHIAWVPLSALEAVPSSASRVRDAALVAYTKMPLDDTPPT